MYIYVYKIYYFIQLCFSKSLGTIKLSVWGGDGGVNFIWVAHNSQCVCYNDKIIRIKLLRLNVEVHYRLSGRTRCLHCTTGRGWKSPRPLLLLKALECAVEITPFVAQLTL